MAITALGCPLGEQLQQHPPGLPAGEGDITCIPTVTSILAPSLVPPPLYLLFLPAEGICLVVGDTGTRRRRLPSPEGQIKAGSPCYRVSAPCFS